jgi:hypothetical protein
MKNVLFHTPSHVKKAKIGGSQIFQKYGFLISLRLASPRFSNKGKKPINIPVWWRAARKTSSQTRLEREKPFFRVDQVNDSKT